MQIIEAIEIKNFRSFGNRRGETIKINKLSELNVISGANDSGKSNILRALNLFFNGFTELEEFYNFQRDYFKKDNPDQNDIKEQITTIKIWFHNENNKDKNKNNIEKTFLPERFWVSKKWKKATLFSQSVLNSSIQTSFKQEKAGNYNNYLKSGKDGSKSNMNASLQKQLTDFLGSIQYHYIPAIKDRLYFSHLYGELQHTLWKTSNSLVNERKNELEKEIQKETAQLMSAFQKSLNHPTLDFKPAFQLSKNMIDLFKTLQVNTGDIDLRNRGDGIQAKLIPEILNFIAYQEKSIKTTTVISGEKSKKYFLWGFEEPENSYEYRNAQLLADRFVNTFHKQAQIFITTHSFNFISMAGDHVAKYRVWKDKTSLSSKISKLKEDKVGGLYLEGGTSEDAILLEELGFFLLNKEIYAAYEKIQETLEQQEQELNDITKPIIYTEGNNAKYLAVAKDLYSQDLDYEIKGPGGTSELQKLFNHFLSLKFSRYKMIFIFDCDAKKIYNDCESKQTDYLVPYLLPQNPKNTKALVQKGIENMFDDAVFGNEQKVFQIKGIMKGNDFAPHKNGKELNKSAVQQFIIEENANIDTFHNFEQVQAFIRTHLT